MAGVLNILLMVLLALLSLPLTLGLAIPYDAPRKLDQQLR